MIFTIIYKNAPDVRAEVIKTLGEAIKAGHDLSQQQVRGNNFQTATGWPNLQSLTNLPLDVQCEELEYKDDKFEIRRVLVVDVEVKIEETPKVEIIVAQEEVKT